MSKASDKAKKKKREQKKKAALLRKQQEKQHLPNVVKKGKSVPEKIISENKFKKKLNRTWSIISTIVIVISIPTYLFWFKDKIHQWTTPEYKLYEEENTIKGILIPEYMLQSTKFLNIVCGSFMFKYPIDSLKKGINFSVTNISCGGDPLAGLKFMILNNRLYTSIDIWEFKTEKLVASMDYNHWGLIKRQFITYLPTDSSIEVIDNYKNVAFSLVYLQPNTIKLQGYFIQSKTITIISNGYVCMDKNNVNEAFEMIKKIKRLN